jgi:glycosyltransferase involved in cell wall biosynthesis
MKLDVIVPTYRRPELLSRLLASLQAAHHPNELEITVVVVDNNSRDETPQIVREFAARGPLSIRYAHEARQGRSRAINAGIEATDGELVGMLDDDEEIDAAWFDVIARNFADPTLDFLGGPCKGRWVTSVPAWLPLEFSAVIGILDAGEARRVYDDNYAGMLWGGNAVIRRSVFERIGLYNPALGRTASGLLSCEDGDMYARLRAAGAQGIYDPDLIIHHYIAPERLTRRYHRRWCYGQGLSLGILDKDKPQPVVYFAGLPRYMIGDVLRALARWAAVHRHGHNVRFTAELRVWQFIGFLVGRYLHRA